MRRIWVSRTVNGSILTNPKEITLVPPRFSAGWGKRRNSGSF